MNIDEIDKGIPHDFEKNVKRLTVRNNNIIIDDPQSQIGVYFETLRRLSGEQSLLLYNNNKSREQVDTELENLAFDVILDQYGDIIKDHEPEIRFIIKMVNDGDDVNKIIPDLQEVPKDSEEMMEETEEQSAKEETHLDSPMKVRIDDLETIQAIYKKTILNHITQGYGKNTKEILSYSERIKNTLDSMYNENTSKRLINIWMEIADIANKMDWIIPIEDKSDMMKSAPVGMAGACDVCFSGESGGGINEEHNGATITAVGIDFPMLIHESIKGFFLLLQSGSIKMDKQMAFTIKSNTSSFSDEVRGFRYGPIIQKAFLNFVLNCEGSEMYSAMDARVFALLALDIGRGGTFTDEEFLNITHSLLYCYDFNDKDGKIVVELNPTRFKSSYAKKQIEEVIRAINEAEMNYERDLEEWRKSQKNSIKSDTTPEVVETEDIDELLDLLSKETDPEKIEALTTKLNLIS